MNEEFREKEKNSNQDQELINLLEETKNELASLREERKKGLSSDDCLKNLNKTNELSDNLKSLEKELNQKSKGFYYKIKTLSKITTPEKIKKIKNEINENVESEPIKNYLNEILDKILPEKEKKAEDQPGPKEVKTLPVLEKEEGTKETPPSEKPTLPLPEEELGEIAKREIEKKEEEIFQKNITKMVYKAAEKLKISEQLRKDVENNLEKIKDQYIREFIMKEWLPAHKKEIEEKMGYPVEKLGDSVILTLFENMDGYQELELKRKEILPLEALPTLILDWRENPTFEGRFLALFFLNEQVSFLEKELKKIEKSKLPKEEKEKKKNLINKEIEELFEIRKELAEKATGRNLREEAEKEIPLQSKEKYVNNYLSLFKKEEKGWFFGKKYLIIDNSKEEEIVREFKNEKDRDSFLQEKKEEAEGNWNKVKEENIKKIIEKEIKEIIPSSPEEAEEKIKESCERIRKNLIEEIKEEIIKPKKEEPKEVRSAIRPEVPDKEELLKKIIKEKCEKAPPCLFREFLEGLIGGLTKEDFTGDIEKDKEKWLKLLEKLGVKPKDFESFIEKGIEKGCKYTPELLDNLAGVIGWIIGSMYSLYVKSIEYLIKEAAKSGGVSISSKKQKQ